MFLQALAGYADRNLRDELEDAAFESRAVPYMISLRKMGEFDRIIPRFLTVATGKPGKDGKPGKTREKPEEMLVPRSPANRNSGLHPLLGADDIKYVLGVGAWTKPAEASNHRERHEAFVELVRRVAAETGDPALDVCVKFYDQSEQVERARAALAQAVPGSNVALFAFGEAVTDRDAVQSWWRKHYAARVAELSSSEQAECLISGVMGPISPTHPKIKGAAALGGQPAGVSLMSFDKGAFRSYGWEQNANSPVSANRAMAYVLALNELLKPGSRHRQDHNGVAFLFWLKEEVEGFDFRSMLEQPLGDVLLDVARKVIRGERARLKKEERNELYMAAVSATGSRLVLRSWSALPLADAIENVNAFWDALKLQPLDPSEQPRSVDRLWKLLYALDRDGEPPASRLAALQQRAIEGIRKPLGYRIVAEALARLRAEPAKRTDIASIGLLRLCLNDLYQISGKGEPMPAALDRDHPHLHPAYVCGRLLALHDSLQWKTFDAAGESQPNAIVADRFYTLVMNSPAIGLAKVFDLGRKHLSKLRKIDNKTGTHYADNFERHICELEEQLGGDVRMRFDLHDKARFALGFYHEKASRFRLRNAAEEASVSESNAVSNNTEEME